MITILKYPFVFFLSFSFFSYSQVGINNTDPKGTLDVTGAPETITINDGIIPPRITRAQLISKTGYGSSQTGAILYVTDLTGTTNLATQNVRRIGTYVFDGTKWNPLQPTLYGFSASRIGIGTTTYSIGNNNILYETVNYDNTNNGYNPITGKFTPTVAGYYQVNASLRVFQGSTTFEKGLHIRKNNTIVCVGPCSIGDQAIVLSANKLLYLNGAGDSIDILLYTGSTLTTGFQNEANFFEAYLVGH